VESVRHVYATPCKSLTRFAFIVSEYVGLGKNSK
jgi:hypothetical protein